jgi:quinol monooxygenase YgiN
MNQTTPEKAIVLLQEFLKNLQKEEGELKFEFLQSITAQSLTFVFVYDDVG